MRMNRTRPFAGFQMRCQNKGADGFLLRVDEGLGGEEVPRPQVEEVREFELLAIHTTPSASVGASRGRQPVSHDVLLGAGQDVQTAVGFGGSAEDRTDREEGVEHQEHLFLQTQSDRGGYMDEACGALVRRVFGMDFGFIRQVPVWSGEGCRA